MKAKKLMGMIACAGACVSLSALANTTNDWFSASVQNNDISLTNVSTNGVAVTIEESKIKIDNEPSSALEFSPVSTNMSTGVAVITATAELTPTDADGFGTDFDNAKVGFAVGVAGETTNYYGFASGVWFALTGANPPVAGNTNFKIVLDYRTAKAQFFVDDAILYTNGVTTFDFNAGGATALGSVAAFGSGSLTEVSGGFELAVAAATVNDVTKKYGSAAEAVIAAGATGTVLDIGPTGEPAPSPLADNGLYVWQCDILGIEKDATIPLQPATKEVASDKIAVAVSGYTPIDGVSVKFNVKKQEDSSVTGPYDADAIGIPMVTGTYTVEPYIKAAN